MASKDRQKNYFAGIVNINNKLTLSSVSASPPLWLVGFSVGDSYEWKREYWDMQKDNPCLNNSLPST